MSLHRQTRWVWRNKSGALTGVACLSLPAILALAEEIRHQVSTCPSVMAGVGATVIDVWQKHLKYNLLCVGAHTSQHHQPVYKIQLRSWGLVSRTQDKPCDLLISQWSPSQPSAQMHWYTLTLSMHVPPLWHGLLSQSLMSETGWRAWLGCGGPLATSCVCRIWTYSRDSKCLWSPPDTRRWTVPQPGSGSGREVHTRWMKCSAHLLECCWMPQQQCSCQSLQRQGRTFMKLAVEHVRTSLPSAPLKWIWS